MDVDNLIADLNNMFTNLRDEFLDFIPKLLLSVVVLIIGYLLARLIKYLIIKLIGYFNKLLNQFTKSSLSYKQLERSANFIGSVFFWLIFLSVFIIISDILGLTLVTDWMERILQYSPNILASIIIILVAVFAGRFLADIISKVSKKVGLTYGNTLGKIAQYLILITAVIIAVDQLGIEVSFLITLVNIVIAALLFGAALAFGLGAKAVVSNILAVFYVRKMYRVGDYIKIGETEGRISKINTTAVVLDTKEGQVLIPAKEFNEYKSFLIKMDDNGY